MFHELTAEQRARMESYSLESLRNLSDRELSEVVKRLPTLESGHMADYKIVTRTFAIAVMRMGHADGYVGPELVFSKLERGRWVDCDKHGNVKAQ